MIETLSTSVVAAPDRLAFWNELATNMVSPMRVEAEDAGSFNAQIRRRAFRAFEIIAPRSSPARIFGAPTEGAGTLNLQVQHVGRSTSMTAGKKSKLEEGDFVLFDPSRPTELSFTEPTEVLILRLPLEYSEARMPFLRQMAGIKMRGDVGAGALFSTFVRNAWREMQTDDSDWADTLNESIWSLLDMAYASERVEAINCTRRDQRRRQLFSIIEANLCNPDLDVHQIAETLCVSVRCVQMICAEMGTTPTAMIQGQRLDLAARRLEREGTGASITEVAYDVGFNDLSSFCRAFRKRFDVAPRDYRAGFRSPTAAHGAIGNC